ncbi:peptidoglycan/xylan/chitin deacetylase (PgdA/CDA1 family) [Kribbella antiqua]|uniref:Peptidoglycan/xylan/chitin deacetylase (PgdA/CDA1 family) n=1 Tax=Kribbella antiqua TaxID=2512217 RepID=A0A4R2ISN4_9ACTN|nr:polysaccharide deacetylase family protein [Kribbella antiqua]TCO47179.1 peptidoglycan/xylan/chitin deacetylase (PgdA/CDA1 family) [Kribbella antiqua]
MTRPPGKLLPLVAALLCGAVLAQAAKPADHSVTSAAPAVQAPAHGPLTVVVKHKQSQPKPPKKPQQQQRTGTTNVVDDWNLAAHGKVLYLTFDDGPQIEWTPKVLQVLAKHKAKATFFVLGREVAAHPDLVARERAAGHRIGNHTWDHPNLTLLPPAKMRQEIATGVKSKCFRPPFRDTNAQVEAVAASYHQRQVLWDVDTEDWSKPGTAKILRAIMTGARPGAIILMHDGGGNRSETVAALDQALTQLTRQGYTYRSLPC